MEMMELCEKKSNYSKSNKSKEIMKDDEEEEDRISPLADSLLVEILSRLDSTKDAITTGTLSKRWQHVWTSVRNLVFQCHHDDSIYDFVPFVNRTLTQCCQLKLNKFELYVNDYESQFNSQVNNWIRYAVNCNVEQLSLELPKYDKKAEFELEEFFYINSCLTHLNLQGCLFIPTGAVGWKKLKSLCLTNTDLDEALIENILSGSPVLETLALSDCYGYPYLDITSKSVKNLVLSGYRGLADGDGYLLIPDIIEINAPNIFSLTIQDELSLQKILLLNVSSLVKADLNYENSWTDGLHNNTEEEMLQELILNLQHVKELKIGIKCFKVLSHLEAEGFISPSNLKVPDVDSLEPSDLIAIS